MNQYTPAQAAAVTGLSLTAVHKALDTHILRPKRAKSGKTVRRLLAKNQIVYLQLEAEGLRVLPLRVRRLVAQAVGASPRAKMLSVGNGTALQVALKPARQKVEAALSRLARIARMVHSDPKIMRGAPVYKGTRIPVHAISDMMAQGANVGEILEGYPSLNREMVELAPVYARAFPYRGRPPLRPWARRKPIHEAVYPLVMKQ